MNFYDTAKDSVGETRHTLGAFIRKEKDQMEQAYITIFFVVIIAAAFFLAGWAFGFHAGALK